MRATRSHHRLAVGLGLAATLALTACGKQASDAPAAVDGASAADSLFYGGEILTMEGDAPQYVEAIAVKDGKVAFAGSRAEAEKRKGASTAVTDLQGKTLLPGMIDTHVHWGQFVMLSALDKVDPAGIGTLDAYMKHMKEVAARTPEGQWIINFGYEKLLVAPFRNLTRADLDAVSTKHPVFALYNNFHWATANSAALEELGIDRKSPTNLPGGGVNFKDEKGEPTGLLTESAVYPIMPVIARLVSPEKQATLPFDVGQELSANGLTTVADLSAGSAAGKDEVLAMQKLARDDRFPLRLSAVVMYDALPSMDGPIAWDGTFQAANCKLLADASLAGGTAATVKPMPGGSTGNLNYTPEKLQEAVRTCLDKGFGVTAHVMGDRANKVVLQAFENLATKYDYARLHNTIEHSALIDPADLPRVKQLGLSVGFLSPFLHAYGDPLRDMVLGDAMASRLFAAVEYDTLGINTAHHSDGPIVKSNPLYLVWTAVNRTTVTGKVLGPELRQAPYAALLGVTRNAARHLGLDRDLGTLGVGKAADLAIVSDNPLKVDPTKIKDIAVLKTIKGGKVYFTKP